MSTQNLTTPNRERTQQDGINQNMSTGASEQAHAPPPHTGTALRSSRSRRGTNHTRRPRGGVAMLVMLLVFSLSLASYLVPASSGSIARAASCDVTGLILSNTTWSPSSCDSYIVTGSLIVNSGVTLTIEAGTLVKFDSHKAMTVNGELKVLGTASNPVRFTSNVAASRGAWDYIYFTASSTSATHDVDTGAYTGGSILQYAIIEYAGGASIDNNAALRLESSPYIDHTTIRYSNSLGIRGWNNSAPHLTNNTINNNSSTGISIEYDGSTTSFVITGNTVSKSEGRGVYLTDGSSTSSVTFSNNTITENTLSCENCNGGGFYLAVDGDNTISGNTVTGNTAAGDGGGFYLNGGTNTINANIITDNSAYYYYGSDGGGFYVSGGSNIISGNTITDNTVSNGYGSAYGGGFYLNNGTNLVSGNTVTGNTVSGPNPQGGGFYVSGGTSQIKSNTITKNKAGEGGGFFIDGYNSNIIINDNTVSDNTANSCGGIKLYRGTHDVQDNTITGNAAGTTVLSTGDGGGVCIGGATSPYFKNNTIANNSVTGNNRKGGGFLISDECNPVINNNRIYGNTAAVGSALYNGNNNSRPTIDAKNNWWGTSDQNTIEAAIHHYVDDASLGIVDYGGYLTTQPESVAISGNTGGYSGTAYTFQATVSPSGASVPIDYTWSATDQSNVSHAGQSSRTDSATFTWNTAGSKTIIITATNSTGTVVDSHTINLVDLVALTGVSITGPVTGTAGTDYTFNAVIDPLNASYPIVYTWSPEPKSGQGSSSAIYNWSTAGSQNIQVTASNDGGSDSASHSIVLTMSEADQTATAQANQTATVQAVQNATAQVNQTATAQAAEQTAAAQATEQTATAQAVAQTAAAKATVQTAEAQRTATEQTAIAQTTMALTATQTAIAVQTTYAQTSTQTAIAVQTTYAQTSTAQAATQTAIAQTPTVSATPTPSGGTSPTCSRDIDIMLVLDGSGSINSTQMSQMKSFATSVVNAFDAGTSGARIGLVQFAAYARTEFGLNNDLAAVKNAISSMSQVNGGTDIQDGLNQARTEIASNLRTGVNPVIILLTDGEHNRSGDPIAEATLAKNEGITIFAIAVGGNTYIKQINAIASDPDATHVFSVSGFDRLSLILSTLVNETCQVTPVTPKPEPTTPVPTVPVVRLVEPSEGYNDTTTDIAISGEGFSTNPVASVSLVDASGNSNTLANVSALSSNALAAKVPAGLTQGAYDVRVTNSDNTTAILPNGFTVLARNPQIIQVLPSVGMNSKAQTINVYGFNFADGAEVKLDTTVLQTTRLNATLLQAVVPAGHPADTYDVIVVNPGGAQAQRTDGYTLLDQSSNNDLTSDESLVWFNPQVARAGEPVQIGVIVQRYGGKNTLQNVSVRFNQDSASGTVLGEKTVPFLDPPTSEDSTMPLEVTFPNAGTYDIYATIDPDNTVPESNENNNVVHRTITVAPAASDSTVPVVQSITINDGDTSPVRSSRVKVDIAATDPDPNPSGMDKIHIIEYIFNQNVQHWIPIARSGWLPYTATPDSYQWSLQPLAGVHYLQVRAADKQANVSIGKARQSVNYEPTFERIGAGETHVYRYQVASGQQFKADLEVLSGDADLYVWSSQTSQSAWVSNQVSGNEQVSVPSNAIVPGTYQVEVYGYSDAEYRLNITTVSGASLARSNVAGVVTAGLAQSKTLPSEPVVAVSSLPDERQGAIPSVDVSSTATPVPSTTVTPNTTTTPNTTPTTDVTEPSPIVYLPVIMR